MRAKAPSCKTFRNLGASGEMGCCLKPVPIDRTTSHSPSFQTRWTSRMPGLTGLLYFNPPSWKVPKDLRCLGLKNLRHVNLVPHSRRAGDGNSPRCGRSAPCSNLKLAHGTKKSRAMTPTLPREELRQNHAKREGACTLGID